MVLAEGEASEAGKWNNTDLKVMIQWFKGDGDKAIQKKKDGLLLHYNETCICVVVLMLLSMMTLLLIRLL
jgi:hypothetical protein